MRSSHGLCVVEKAQERGDPKGTLLCLAPRPYLHSSEPNGVTYPCSCTGKLKLAVLLCVLRHNEKKRGAAIAHQLTREASADSPDAAKAYVGACPASRTTRRPLRSCICHVTIYVRGIMPWRSDVPSGPASQTGGSSWSTTFVQRASGQSAGSAAHCFMRSGVHASWLKSHTEDHDCGGHFDGCERTQIAATWSLSSEKSSLSHH